MADTTSGVDATVLAAGKAAAVDPGHAKWVEIVDTALHSMWALGRNIVLVWSSRSGAMDVLVVPHFVLSEFVASGMDADSDLAVLDGDERSQRSQNVIEGVIARPKIVSQQEMAHLSKLLGTAPMTIELPFTPGEDVSIDVMEAVVKRYGISYVEDRAVALFDIVGFSLLSPLEQVTQLNSLSYSVNAAYSKMLSNNIDISFARSTTGDGFYIWNRDRSIQANVNLYHFMHLVLADNAIARGKSRHNTTPLLRACFHVGGHYEFYQSEGLSPTVYSYIVGDVTIELARMIDYALPGQVLVGDFFVPMPDWELGRMVRIDTLQFIDKTQETLSSLKGLELSGDEVDSIKCYLTGDQFDNGEFGVRRYRLVDKHRKQRSVYNAKINIYRRHGDPIYLGLQTRDLIKFGIGEAAYATRSSATE
ncbi:MAG: hypothetical protein RIC16_03155 [Rhodospirillales bacterium]